MTISVTNSDGELKIAIDGRFDFSSHKEFRDAYKGTASDTNYVIDMGSTDYMDSSALGMLLLLREHAGGDKARIKISGCSTDIKKILTISNFHKLFDIA